MTGPFLSGRGPYLYALGAILCWSSLAAVVGQGLKSLAPELVLFYGLAISALSLSFAQLAQAFPRPPTRSSIQPVTTPLRNRLFIWPGFQGALLGIYGIWGYHALLIFALSRAPKIEANILNYTWPLWIVLLGSALPGHKLSLKITLAGLLGFAGVLTVMGGELQGDFALKGNVIGLSMALGAGFIFGSFTVLLRSVMLRKTALRKQNEPSQPPTMASFCLLATIPSGLMVLASDQPFLPPTESWPLLIFLGTVPLGLAFLLWEKAVQTCHVQVLGQLSFLTPVLSTILLALTSGEGLKSAHALALGLILTGAAIGRKG